MARKYARRALYLAPETSYAQATRPVDANYVAIPAAGALEFSGGPETVESTRITGRSGPGAATAGPTGATGQVGLELSGLSTQAGDGESPPAEDYFDLLMSGVANATPTERDGVTIASLSGTALDLGVGAASLYSAGDLIALVNTTTGIVRWAGIASNDTGGDYTLDYAVDNTPNVAYGSRVWEDDDGTDLSVTFSGSYDVDDILHEIPGLRVSGWQISSTPGGIATCQFDFSGDDFRAFGTDPVFTAGTNGDPGAVTRPPKARARLYLDGVRVPTSGSLQIAGGVETAPVVDDDAESGRGDFLAMAVTPVVSFQTPYAATYDTLNRTKEIRDLKLMYQIGAGSRCLWIPYAQIRESAPADASGIANSSLSFGCVVNDSTTTRWLFGGC